jgi:hypothetical protein
LLFVSLYAFAVVLAVATALVKVNPSDAHDAQPSATKASTA